MQEKNRHLNSLCNVMQANKYVLNLNFNNNIHSISEQLQSFVQEATQSSTSGNLEASLAFDGNENTFSHTRMTAPHWIKAVFKQRVFVEYVTIVNRANLVGTSYENRIHYIDFFTVLHTNGQSVQTLFGNTGQLEDRKTLICQRYADELFANQPVEQAADVMNIAEIWIYGHPK